jgi:hypothetical protein
MGVGALRAATPFFGFYLADLLNKT